MKDNFESLKESWEKFAEAYDFTNMPNQFFKIIECLHKIHEGRNNLIYPYFLFPAYMKDIIEIEFKESSNADEGISFHDLREAAEFLDIEIYNGNWDAIPVFPKNVLIRPKKKTIYNQKIIEVVRDKFGKTEYVHTPIVKSKLSKEKIVELQNFFDKEYEYSLKTHRKATDDFKKYGNLFKLQRDIINKNIDLLARVHIYNKMLIEENELKIEKNVPYRGKYEDNFFSALMDRFPDFVKINRKKGPYYPDIVLCVDAYNYIDVEIDEPYELSENKEIHYIGCGDEDRNEYFVNKNWFVLRFSEQNIKDHLEQCIDLIDNLTSFLKECKIKYLENFIKVNNEISHPQWTIEQARLMRIRKFRK